MARATGPAEGREIGMRPIGSMVRDASQFLWRRDLHQLPRWKRGLVFAARIAVAVLRDLFAGRLNLHAASLVYTTLLSLVPLLAVAFSILTALGVKNALEPVLLDLLAPLGVAARDLVVAITGFVNRVRADVLGSIGAVLLFYTSFSLAEKLTAALNEIWQVPETRPLLRRISADLSVILIGPVVVFSSVGALATLGSNRWVATMLSVGPFEPAIELAGRAVPFLIAIAAFTVIYWQVPSAQVAPRNAVIGGIVAGLLWQSVGWAFAAFLGNAGSYQAIYTTFAIVVLLLIWLDLAWLILLIGANVAHYAQHPGRARPLPANRIPGLRDVEAERLGLVVMLMIARRFYRDEPNWSSAELQRRLALPEEVVEAILDQLVDRELLARSDDRPHRYVPAKSPGTVTLEAVIAAMRQAEPSSILDLSPPTEAGAKAEQVIAAAETAARRSLEGATVKDLALSAEEKREEPAPETVSRPFVVGSTGRERK